MKLYRNHRGSDEDSSDGYSWHLTRRAALAEIAANPEYFDWAGSGPQAEEHEFNLSKRGVLRLLNSVANYADNG